MYVTLMDMLGVFSISIRTLMESCLFTLLHWYLLLFKLKLFVLYGPILHFFSIFQLKSISMKHMEKKRSTAEKNISFSVLQRYFSGSLKDAANSIGGELSFCTLELGYYFLKEVPWLHDYDT